MDLKELKNLVNEVLEEQGAPRYSDDLDRHRSLFNQFMRGMDDEVALLTDEQKKELLAINYAAGNNSVSATTIAALADADEGYEQRWLESVMKLVERFKEVKNEVEKAKDDEFRQNRAAQAKARYPAGRYSGD